MNSAGKKIRAQRQQRGWTQEFLAGKLNITVTALSKIETGITDINLSRLEQISWAFGLSIGELMKDDEWTIRTDKTLCEAENELSQKEAEVMWLQKKLIDLFEDLGRGRKSVFGR